MQRAAHAGFERLLRLSAALFADPARVDRVAPVVAGAAGNEGLGLRVRPVRALGFIDAPKKACGHIGRPPPQAPRATPMN